MDDKYTLVEIQESIGLLERLKKIFSPDKDEQPEEIQKHAISGDAVIQKSVDGNHYLVARFTNRWRDRDYFSNKENGGEIITDAAHREYMAWLDKNPDKAPQLWTWHVPGTQRKERARWWDYSGNFAYMMWQLEPDEATKIVNWSKKEKLGLSHGFISAKIDHQKGLIQQYRTYEVSVLPAKSAANPWTDLEIISKEQEIMAEKGFSKEKRAALVALHGEEFVLGLEESDLDLANALQNLGVESKEAKEAGEEPENPVEENEAEAVEAQAQEEPEAEAEEKEVTEDEPQAEDGAENGAQVTYATEKAVVEALDRMIEKVINPLVQEVKELKEQLAEAKAENDQRAKEIAAPPSILSGWLIHETKSVLEDDDAQVDGRSSLAKSKPSESDFLKNTVLDGMFA